MQSLAAISRSRSATASAFGPFDAEQFGNSPTTMASGLPTMTPLSPARR